MRHDLRLDTLDQMREIISGPEGRLLPATATSWPTMEVSDTRPASGMMASHRPGALRFRSLVVGTP